MVSHDPVLRKALRKVPLNKLFMMKYSREGTDPYGNVERFEIQPYAPRPRPVNIAGAQEVHPSWRDLTSYSKLRGILEGSPNLGSMLHRDYNGPSNVEANDRYAKLSVYGDAAGCEGDVTGLYGNLTEVSGNLSGVTGFLYKEHWGRSLRAQEGWSEPVRPLVSLTGDLSAVTGNVGPTWKAPESPNSSIVMQTLDDLAKAFQEAIMSNPVTAALFSVTALLPFELPFEQSIKDWASALIGATSADPNPWAPAWVCGTVQVRGSLAGLVGCLDNITGECSNIYGVIQHPLHPWPGRVKEPENAGENGLRNKRCFIAPAANDKNFALTGDVSKIRGCIGRAPMAAAIDADIKSRVELVEFLHGEVEDDAQYARLLTEERSGVNALLNHNAIWGNCSNIKGDVTNIRGNVTNIKGDVSNLSGCVTMLRGTVTNIRGKISDELEGDVSKLRGDISLLKGDVTNLEGDATEIMMTNAERVEGNLDAIPMPVLPALGGIASAAQGAVNAVLGMIPLGIDFVVTVNAQRDPSVDASDVTKGTSVIPPFNQVPKNPFLSSPMVDIPNPNTSGTVYEGNYPKEREAWRREWDAAALLRPLSQ